MTQDPAPSHSTSLADSSTDSVTNSVTDSVRTWVAEWGDEVAGVRIDAGRRRFADDLVAFGTYADIVVGADEVMAAQWSNVWPTIEDFRFTVEELVVQASPDGLLAVAIVPWSSTGIAEDGTRFDRPGRATIVLRRAGASDPWLGTHTHFSLGRGVPQRSYGHRERSA